MKVVAADFFGRGLFGQVALGAPRVTMIDCLGEPDDTSIQKRPTEILKYGNVQIHCNNVVVVLIVVYLWSTTLPVHRRIDFDGWGNLWGCTAATFQATMDALSIPYQENHALTLGNQRAFVVGNAGAGSIFVDDTIDHVDLYDVRHDRRGYKG